MHSGLILLFWLSGVLLVQQLAGLPLAVCVTVSLALAWGLARERTLRLLRRIRFFLLAIVIFFAWFIPGEALWVSWPMFSPSREGGMLSLQHAGRLIAIVCWVAVLLHCLSVERLISGLYAVCRPFVVLGLSAERLAVRLLLTLRYVEGGTVRQYPVSGWKAWLTDETDDVVPGETCERIVLHRERLGFWDYIAVLGAAGLLVWVKGWWW